MNVNATEAKHCFRTHIHTRTHTILLDTALVLTAPFERAATEMNGIGPVAQPNTPLMIATF